MRPHRDTALTAGRVMRSLPNSTYIFLFVFVVFLFLIPNFGSAGNLSALLQQASILSLLSAAMAPSIMAREIDLSVGSIVSFTGIVIALGLRAELGELLSIFLGLAAATVFGIVNGFIVVKMKVVPFIATFGMMGIGQGLANILSNKRAMYLTTEDGPPLPLIAFLQKDIVSIPLGDGSLFSISMIVVITAFVLGLLIFFFRRTVLHAYVYAIGNNPEAAKLCNIRVDFWGTAVLAMVGFLSGIAGFLMLLRVNSAQPTAGDGLEFQAVVAAVLGGNLLSGGKGSIPGAILGALVVYMVRNGLTLLGVHSNYVMVVLGMVLILGMVMNDLASRGFKRTRKEEHADAAS